MRTISEIHSRRLKYFFSTLCLLIGISAFPVKAQEAQSSGDALISDSQTSLFGYSQPDSRVNLFIDGSWQAGAALQLGLRRVASDQNANSWGFDQVLLPGFAPAVLSNIVDLTLSLRLDERYYFETVFVDEFEIDTILFGYDGQSDELLQRFRVGLGPIAIDDYPGIPSGRAGDSVAGSDFRLETSRSVSEAMLRYVRSQPEVLRVQGGEELTRTRIGSLTYLRGQRFVIPDRPLTTIAVFIESESGVEAADGRRYRQLDLNRDAVVSLSRGTVSLNEPPRGRVLAVYTTENGSQAGDSGTGGDFVVPVTETGFVSATGIDSAAARFDATRSNLGSVSAGGGSLPGSSPGDDFLSRTRRTSGDAAQDAMFVEIGDQWAALLYEPGYFSPFERLDAYPLSRTAAPGDFPDTRLVYASGDAEFFPPRAVTERFSADGELLLFGSLNPDDPAARYPFGSFASLYGPSAGPGLRSDAVPFDIQFETSDNIEQVRLPAGAVSGSVSMTRNGVQDTRFEVGDDGTVRLTSPALPQDILEFRFRNSESEGASGTLEAVAGSRFTLSENTELTAGLRYTRDLLDTAFTTRSNEATSETEGALSWRFAGERARAGVLAELTSTRADTTGVRRLVDIDATRTPLSIVPWRSLPGAEPEEAREILDETGTQIVGPGATVEDRTPWSGSRGRLLFRDYLDGTGFLPFGTVLDDDRMYDWGDGGFTGPYLASLPDGSAGNPADRAIVVDYELDATGDWVSAQLQLGPDAFGETPGGLRFRLHALAIDGPVDVYLQLGATAEDLDADGVSDRGAGPTDPYFDFEQTPGLTLRAGGQPFPDASGEPAREDILRRGFLAVEDVNRIVTRRILEGLDSADTEDFVIEFTREEIERMDSPRALRMVVVRSGAPASEPARGALLVSDVELLSRPVTARRIDPDGLESAGPASARSVPESAVRLEGGTTLPRDRFLSAIFPDSTAFLGPVSDDSDNRVLAVRGGGNAGVEVSAIHSPARLSEYRVFAFYMHTGTIGASGPVRVKLRSGADSRSAVVASFDLPLDANWQRIEVDTTTGEITRLYLSSGTSGEVQREAVGHATLNRNIDVQSTEVAVFPDASISDWTVYIDEPHLSGSRSRLDAAIAGDFSYQGPDEWLTAPGGVRVGSLETDISAGLNASVADGSRADLAAQTVRLDARSGFIVGNLSISLNTDWIYVPPFDEHTMLLGHRLSTDAPWNGLRVEEVYTRSMTSVGRVVEDHRLSAGYDRGIWQSDLSARSSIRADRREHRQTASFSAPYVSGNLGLAQTGSDASLLVDRPYFFSWLSSFRSLTPEAFGEPDRRSGNTSLDISLGSGPVNTHLNFDSAWTALPASPQLSADSGVRLSADIEAFGDAGVLFTPFYERRVAISEEGDPIAGYRDDVSRIAASVGPEETALYASIPFVELFVDNAPRVLSLMRGTRSSTRYTPSTGLEFTRPLQTRLRDLILPYRLAVATSREFSVEDSSTASTGRLSSELNARAVNLFGSLGAYPLARWFRSDEYETRFRFLAEYGDTPGDRVQHQYQTVLDWRVFPGPETEISLYSETTVERGDRSGYDHSTRLQGSIEHDTRLADALPVPVTYEQSILRSEHDLRMRIALSDEPLDILSITGGTRVTALYDSRLRLTLGARLGYEVTGFRTASMTTRERVGLELRFTGRLRF